MSDPIQSYSVEKIDEFVERGVGEHSIDIPEEIKTEMADAVTSPRSISSAIWMCCSGSTRISSTIRFGSTCGKSPRRRC